MAPLTWVRRIASELPELNTIPLFGNSPPFDWNSFSLHLASRIGVSKIGVRSRDAAWKEASQIKKGLGSEPNVTQVALSPLGIAYWLMSKEDVAKLTSWLMKPSSKSKAPLSELLQEGFYRYLALETLDQLQGMEPFKSVTLQLNEEESSLEKAFCIDIEIEIDQKSCWGRLVLPSELRSRWIDHFSNRPSEYFSAEIAHQVELSLGIKTGSVILHQEDLEKMKVGDFVLLDQGAYDPNQGTGLCLVMLHSTPLFNAKVKHNKIELTDYAFYYEDNMAEKGETHPEKRKASPEQEEGEMVALKELPLYVTVEIARLKMTLDQLMHLTPGNTLDLPIHPDQGVSLTVNGQKIGRAELVYLGEQLGVRILEI